MECISLHNGFVVGDYQTSAKAPSRGFTLHNGTYRTLQVAPAKKDTYPQCGNDHGEVAGMLQVPRLRIGLPVQARPVIKATFLFPPATDNPAR